MSRRLLPVLLIACLPVLGPGRAQARSQASGPSTAALVGADNQFGFALFRALSARQPASNLFISPLSAALALQMAFDGAHGTTARGMARVLGVESSSAAVRSAAGRLLPALSSGRGTDGLRVANSLWGRSGVPFRAPFLQHARSAYHAQVQSLDFHSPTAPVTINRWVKSATAGKIPSIVDRIPPDVILYLIDAVFFRGSWAQPFSPSATHLHAFTTSHGTMQVQLMSEQGIFTHAKTSQVEVITLPYKGGRFTTSIVLPAPGTSLQTLARGLSTAVWKGWTAHTHPAYGSISLPRMALTDDHQLMSPLVQLGMGSAFSDSADFSGMCVQPCRLSQARQKTFLHVDENGTTAAAATSVGVSPTAVQQQTFSMVVDRPFFLSIEDAATGSILFFGAVTSPS